MALRPSRVPGNCRAVQEGLRLRGVALWTVAFCAHRAAVLWWGFNGLFYWEETYRLLVAEVLLDGWNLPLMDLQADPYAGGSLVFSALAVPVVAVAGPSIVGLKLVALLWSAVGLVAWTLLIDRFWGCRAAHVFAFLFVFAPPLFVVYNLIAMGSHAEVVTLGGIQLLLAYRYLYGGTRSTRALVAWAAVAGLGTWFTYVSILPFLVCVAVGLVAGALPPRRWPALAAGFLGGLAPWILTNLASGGRGLDVVFRTFHGGPAGGAHSLVAYREYLVYLLRTGIPLGLHFPDVVAPLSGAPPRRLLLALVYLALYAASWGVLIVSCLVGAWRRAAGLGARVRALAGACPELPLLLLFPAFTLLLAATDQVFLEHELVPFISFRLLVPLLPTVMFALAVAASRLGARWRWALVLALGLMGMAGTVQLLAAGSSDRPRIAIQARSLGAEAMGHLLYYKHGADMPLLAERIAAMPDELRSPAYQGIGFSLAYHYPESQPIAGFVATIVQAPSAFRADVVRGVRLALGPGMAQVNAVPVSARTHEMLAAVAALDPLEPGQ